MKIETVDGSRERQVLISLVTSKQVLAQVAAHWRKDFFYSRWSQAVAQLCVNFYRKHQDAPGKAMASLFATWSERQQDQEIVDRTSSFLASLSDEYEQQPESNPAYMIDVANRHFREVLAHRFKEAFESALAAHNLEAAEELIATYHKVEMGANSGIDLFQDENEVAAVFDDDASEKLIDYPKPLNTFFQDTLCRDSFIAFLGTDKSGKSMWLLDLAWRAMLQRRRVAYFEAGDMSKKQIERRFLVRAAVHPSRSSHPEGNWPCKIRMPEQIKIGRNAEGGRTTSVTYKPLTFDVPLNRELAWQACEKIMHGRINSKRSFFKLSCHPNSTLTVATIRATLEEWTVAGWVPDVVIIDYADILAPPVGKMEVRDQINTNWKQLRTLSQEFHCLVATATQSDAKGYEQGTLSRRNFSEDKRKLAHVTAMFGINKTDDEQEKGLCRLNYIVRREGSYSTRKCITVGQCLALAQPAVLAAY